MNDADLQRKLRTLGAPALCDTAQERARHRALLAFSSGAAERVPVRSRGGYGWAVAGVAALVLTWVLCRPHPSAEPAPNASVLTQVESLFPGQLNAVIEDEDGEVKVALASHAQPPSDQPLLVEFRRGDELVRVFSYSGRRICINLGGRHACFEALIGDDGQVIVAGEDFLSTAQNRVLTRGWQVTAASLGGNS